MPRRKHWFHVSHEINEDPQVWELTDKYRSGGLRVLLEYNSICDKTENHFQDTKEQWEAIFRKCRVTYRVGWEIRQRFATNHWLVIGESAVDEWRTFCGSPNYWKYHNLTEPKGIRYSFPPIPIPIPSPFFTNVKNVTPPAAPSISKTSGGKMPRKTNLPDLIRAQTDLLYGINSAQFKRENILAWYFHTRKSFPDELISEALKKLIPYCAEVEIWRPYLDKILEVQTMNGEEDRIERENEARKRAEGDMVKDFNEKFPSLLRLVKDIRGAR